MTERLSQKELESYLWGAATLLRGLIDASDYKQYIFPLLFEYCIKSFFSCAQMKVENLRILKLSLL